MCVHVFLSFVVNKTDIFIFLLLVSFAVTNHSLPCTPEANCHAFPVCILYCKLQLVINVRVKRRTKHSNGNVDFVPWILNDANHFATILSSNQFLIRACDRSTLRDNQISVYSFIHTKNEKGKRKKNCGVVKTLERYYFQFNFRFFVLNIHKSNVCPFIQRLHWAEYKRGTAFLSWTRLSWKNVHRKSNEAPTPTHCWNAFLNMKHLRTISYLKKKHKQYVLVSFSRNTHSTQYEQHHISILSLSFRFHFSTHRKIT